MGQFQPMVKMMTTEPSVELKLKKGGKVVKKADGGMMGMPMSAARGMPPPMPARGGMPGGMAPMKPSLAMRRRAMKGLPAGAGPAGPVGGAAQMQPSMPAPAGMPAMPAPAGMPGMKKGGKADTSQDKAMIKKAFKQHDMQEHKGGKGTSLKLKHGGKMATGGVVNGQGGFATGGVVKGQGGYATGGVTKSNGGGYKKGGKIKGMMDGGMAGNGMMGGGMMDDGMSPYGAYKKGGVPKKAYAAGGTVNSGRPVAMPQGNKKPSAPVSINQLSGTFKKGGKVTPAEGSLMKAYGRENAPAMKSAKAQSNEVYSKYQKMKDGGSSTPDERFFDKNKVDPKSASDKASRELEDAMNPMSMVKELAGKAKNFFMPKGSESVTKTKESVTVSPGRKRGGSVC